MNEFRRNGILFVVSAPSGTGKSTLCANLKDDGQFRFSVSCTTRAPRRGEEDGVDYHFISPEDFDERVRAGRFLEHAEVHGSRYGTPLEPALEAIESGMDLLLDIDVQGAAQVRACTDARIRPAIVDIFIMPPTIEELEHRLRKRGTETAEQMARRLANARLEMPRWREYRYTILSGTMEEDLQKFRSIMRAERYKSERLTPISGEAAS
jgi:guanylate kinase